MGVWIFQRTLDLAGVEPAGSRWQPGSSAQQAQGRLKYTTSVPAQKNRDASPHSMMMFDFFIGKLERAIFGPPDKVKIVNQLMGYALKRGFRTFRNNEFRVTVKFSELSTVEQDRMFNELIASNIVLVLLMIDTFAKLSERGVQEYLRSLCDTISSQLAEKLRGIGIADDHVNTWIKLLELRRDEYEEGRLQARGSLPEFGKGNPWVRVIPVGCLFHIRRGKSIDNDPLFPLLMKDSLAVANATEEIILRTVRRL